MNSPKIGDEAFAMVARAAARAKEAVFERDGNPRALVQAAAFRRDAGDIDVARRQLEAVLAAAESDPEAVAPWIAADARDLLAQLDN